MPNIFFEGPQLTLDQKRELARGFTEVASRVTGIPAQAFVVTLKENAPENVGIGGQLLIDRQK